MSKTTWSLVGAVSLWLAGCLDESQGLSRRESPLDEPLTVTINQADGQEDPTSTSPVLFTVVFSRAVVGFTAEDVDLSESTGDGLSARVTGSGANYTVFVSFGPVPEQETFQVTAKINFGVSEDNEGQVNEASTSDDNSVACVPLNAPPSAVDDAYGVDQGGFVSGNVLDNDSDPNHDPLEAILLTAPAHAAAFHIEADGTFEYTHDCGADDDSFVYVANDGELDSAPAHVLLTVTPIQALLEALDDDVSTTPMPRALRTLLQADLRVAEIAWRAGRVRTAMIAMRAFIADIRLLGARMAPEDAHRLIAEARAILDVEGACAP